jgi:hypothetical protein
VIAELRHQERALEQLGRRVLSNLHQQPGLGLPRVVFLQRDRDAIDLHFGAVAVDADADRLVDRGFGEVQLFANRAAGLRSESSCFLPDGAAQDRPHFGGRKDVARGVDAGLIDQDLRGVRHVRL